MKNRIACLVVLVSFIFLSGCGADEPKGAEGDAGKNRADMIKWHQEHDKKQTPPASS